MEKPINTIVGIIIVFLGCLSNNIVSFNNILQVRVLSLPHVNLLKLIENDQILLSDIPRINKTIYISIYESKNISKIIKMLNDEKIEFQQDSNIYKRKILNNHIENDNKYLTWEEFENWIQEIKTINNPIIMVETIGKSFEGRNIYSIKFGKSRSKYTALIDSGAHAREWLSIASVIGTVNNIISEIKIPKNKYWTVMLNNWNIYFIPLLNPDGYAYSIKNMTTRYWRKNRQIIPNSACSGIDINRNFPIGFESSEFSCSGNYGGVKPFTTSESQSLRNLITDIGKDLKLYISFHCFGQFILLPWAFKNEKPIDYMDLKNVANSIQNSIFNVNLNNFSIGTPGELMYNAGGTSYDWVKSLGVPYSYTIELSPNELSGVGFIVPESFIKNSTTEVYESIKMALLKIKL